MNMKKITSESRCDCNVTIDFIISLGSKSDKRNKNFPIDLACVASFSKNSSLLIFLLMIRKVRKKSHVMIKVTLKH